MKIWKIMVPLVIIVAAIYAVPRIGKSTVIEQDGNQLSITIGKHRLTTAVISNQITDSFLVISGSPGGDMYFTTLLSVVPLDTAERLYRIYGDFRKCGSPGAAEGMRSVIPVLLYADNRNVERKLKTVNKLANAVKDPVIKMTFAQLNINDHKIEHNGQMVQVTSQDTTDAFLVKNIQIIQEEHNF
ncbi:MAG: hypothetical protein ACYTBX_07815 [Planctomycetota bacterium]|jgi:hypothetical protein